MTLMKMVVMTNMLVKFTERAASKKNGLKKVVAKVIIMSNADGKKVVNISLIIFLLRVMVIQIPSLGALSFL